MAKLASVGIRPAKVRMWWWARNCGNSAADCSPTLATRHTPYVQGAVGNAAKQSAMEAWLPLADVLLGALVEHVPPPGGGLFAPQSPRLRISRDEYHFLRRGTWFCAMDVQVSLDGRHHFAIGRVVDDPRQIELALEMARECGCQPTRSPGPYGGDRGQVGTGASANSGVWFFLGTGQATRTGAPCAGALLGLLLPPRCNGPPPPVFHCIGE